MKLTKLESLILLLEVDSNKELILNNITDMEFNIKTTIFLWNLNFEKFKKYYKSNPHLSIKTCLIRTCILIGKNNKL